MPEPAREQTAEAAPAERREAGGAGPGPTLRSEALRLQSAVGNRAAARLIPRILARQPAAAAATSSGSKLVGLKRKLSWDDYKAVAANDQRLRGFEAATKLSHSVTVGGSPVGPSAFAKVDGGYRLKNQVVVTVQVSGFQGPSVAKADAKQQQLLLDHEQGHYALWALNCRDGFLEIMALKQRTFATAQDGSDALTAIVNSFSDLALRIDKAYDGDTNHKAMDHSTFGPRKPPEQTKWEGFVQTAFTKERDPYQEAPDGAAYKVPIATVLRDRGITF